LEFKNDKGKDPDQPIESFKFLFFVFNKDPFLVNPCV